MGFIKPITIVLALAAALTVAATAAPARAMDDRGKARVLTIGLIECAPFVTRDGDQLGGTTVAALRALDAHLPELEFRFTIVPPMRAVLELAKGMLDGVAPLMATGFEDSMLAFTETPLHPMRVVVARLRPDDAVPGDWAPHLSDRMLGAVSGAERHAVPGTALEASKIVTVTKEARVFQLLERGRIDYALGYAHALAHIAERQGLSARLETLPVALHQTDGARLAVNRMSINDTLRRRIDTVLRQQVATARKTQALARP